MRKRISFIEIRDGETAVLCTTDDGYAYVIMPLSRDHKP